MRIRILGLSSNGYTHFSSDFGDCRGKFCGSCPVIGEELDVEFAVPEIESWDAPHVEFLPDNAPPKIGVSKDYVFLQGRLDRSGADKNFVALRLANNLVVLSSRTPCPTGFTTVRIKVDSITIYDSKT